MRACYRRLDLGLVAATLLLTERAVALPAPMSDQELLDASDLVIDGLGAEVECQGPPVTSGNLTYTYYVSRVFPSQTLKGEAMRTVEVVGYLMEYLEPIAGGWSPDPVPVGWSGRLHLVRNDDATYSEVWWNGFTEDTASAPEPLPDCGAGGAGGMGGQGGSGPTGGASAGGAAGAATTGGVAGASIGGIGGESSGGVAGDVTGGTGGAPAGGAAGALVGGSGGALPGGTGGGLTGGAAGESTGGTGGAVTGGTGGASTGGTGGASDEDGGESSGGTAGAMTGAGGSGPSGGVGGSSSETGGNAGGPAADEPGSPASSDTSGDDGGCGCRVPAGRTPSGGLALLLGAVACLARTRRNRRVEATER